MLSFRYTAGKVNQKQNSSLEGKCNFQHKARWLSLFLRTHLVSLRVWSKAADKSRPSVRLLKARPRICLLWMGTYWLLFKLTALIILIPQPETQNKAGEQKNSPSQSCSRNPKNNPISNAKAKGHVSVGGSPGMRVLCGEGWDTTRQLSGSQYAITRQLPTWDTSMALSNWYLCWPWLDAGKQEWELLGCWEKLVLCRAIRVFSSCGVKGGREWGNIRRQHMGSPPTS